MPEKDLYDKIEDRDFDTKLPYPHKPIRPMLHYKHNSQQATVYAEALVGYEEDIMKWQEDLKKYNADIMRLKMEFKKEAIAYCGITNHSKADKAWDMAWSREHDAGYSAVLEELENLADLLV